MLFKSKHPTNRTKLVPNTSVFFSHTFILLFYTAIFFFYTVILLFYTVIFFSYTAIFLFYTVILFSYTFILLSDKRVFLSNLIISVL